MYAFRNKQALATLQVKAVFQNIHVSSFQAKYYLYFSSAWNLQVRSGPYCAMCYIKT